MSILLRSFVFGARCALALGLFVGSLSVPLTAADIPLPEAAAAADRDFAEFQAAKKLMPPRELDRAGFARWSDEELQKLAVRGVALFEKYPHDPRRWEVVQFLGAIQLRFIKEIGPDFETAGAKAIVADEAAKAAWQAKLASLKQAMKTATDVPPGPREEMDWTEFARDFRAATAALRAGQPVNWETFRARYDAHAAKYAALDAMLIKRADDYLGALGKNVPDAAVAGWSHLAIDSPNAALRQHATDKRRLAETMGRPLEMKFTASDGRVVDLASLRGKVVLIDFWATWCGPCKEEIPNLRNAYAAYHEKGFEIVGIALENAMTKPGDTPAQTEEKLTKAREVLAEFTARERMPWPQHFDGKFWKNEFAVQYKIAGIPAMFLLDQEGRVVSTNARGATLDREVRRLLKL